MRTFVALGVAVTAAAAFPNAPASAGGLLAPIWSGAYIGLDAGAGWGTVRDATYSQSIDLAGLTGGLHAGYNFQIGNIVLGAEADAILSGAGATLPLGPASSVSLDLNWAASIRGRLGFAFGPLLLYGTGGVAWSQLAYDSQLAGASVSDGKSTLSGYVIGGGIEAKIMPNAAVRIEALHYMFEKQPYSAFDLTGHTYSALTSTQFSAGARRRQLRVLERSEYAQPLSRSTSLASLILAARYVEPPRSGWNFSINSRCALRMSSSLAPAFNPRISSASSGPMRPPGPFAISRSPRARSSRHVGCIRSR